MVTPSFLTWAIAKATGCFCKIKYLRLLSVGCKYYSELGCWIALDRDLNPHPSCTPCQLQQLPYNTTVTSLRRDSPCIRMRADLSTL